MPLQYDASSLYQFLTGTPEGGLRKMLVDGKPMTETHFSLLMKVVKGCNEEDFGKHWEAGSYPTVRMSPNETKLKEFFWRDCVKTFESRGLLQPATPSKAA